MTDGDLSAKAKKEHKRRLAGKGYKPPTLKDMGLHSISGSAVE